MDCLHFSPGSIDQVGLELEECLGCLSPHAGFTECHHARRRTTALESVPDPLGADRTVCSYSYPVSLVVLWVVLGTVGFSVLCRPFTPASRTQW